MTDPGTITPFSSALGKSAEVVLGFSGYWPDRKDISDSTAAHSRRTSFYIYTYNICGTGNLTFRTSSHSQVSVQL